MTITVEEKSFGHLVLKGDPEDHLDAKLGEAIMAEAYAITQDHLPYKSMSIGYDFDPHIATIDISVKAVEEVIKHMSESHTFTAKYKVQGGGVIMPSRPAPYDKGMINVDVEALVIFLGTLNADEIASWLSRNGYAGIPGDGWDCPIARAIFGETGQHCVVSRGSIIAQNGSLDAPPSITRFIEMFDGGRYKSLINHQPVEALV